MVAFPVPSRLVERLIDVLHSHRPCCWEKAVGLGVREKMTEKKRTAVEYHTWKFAFSGVSVLVEEVVQRL